MHGGFSNKYSKILEVYEMLIDKEDPPINNFLKAALVPVSIKCYIKMKNSGINDEKIEMVCKNNIKKYTRYLVRNKYIGLRKRIVLTILGVLVIRRKCLLPEKVINYIDKNFG